MPDALDTDKPERKAMSQESEVTKLGLDDKRPRSPIEACIELFAEYAHPPSMDGRAISDLAARARKQFASAPPADARLREALEEAHDALCMWCAMPDSGFTETDPRWRWWYSTAKARLGALEKIDAALRSSPASSEPENSEHGDYDNIASMLPSMLASGSERCPLCGQQGVHEHTPGEIIIYRNGVKYGRSLAGTGPAASEPEKGARETPALDEFIDEAGHESRCAVFNVMGPRGCDCDLSARRVAARAELSALKSAAPERPAMAVEEIAEALLSTSLICSSQREPMLPETARFLARGLLAHITPAAASPTVKMPERATCDPYDSGDIAHASGWNACLNEFSRLNPPASPQDGKERA